MIRIVIILFFGTLFLFSCDGGKNREEGIQNQLIISTNGDTLENGFWSYEMNASGVSQRGNYLDGFKIGKWTYKTDMDSLSIIWNIYDKNSVKFNIPDRLRLIDNMESPILFQADIVDNDDNTYLVLLRYNLKELNSSIYGYMYQYSHSWEKNDNELLITKEFKKFSFKGVEIFRANVETEIKTKYQATSNIFVINDFLYDLTYKQAATNNNAIEQEVFNDILYSMECDSIDLFNHFNRKYLKEEDVKIK